MEPLLNKQRALQIMQENNLDYLIAATPENVFYASGFQSFSQWLIRGVKTMVLAIIDKNGEVTLVGPAGEMDRPACNPPAVDQYIVFDYVTIGLGDKATWREEDQRYVEIALTPGRPNSFWDAIEATKLRNAKRIAVDDCELLYAFQEKFASEIIDGRPLFNKIRLIKTPEEAIRIRRAVEITEIALERSMDFVREGMTEKELGDIFDRELLAAGGKPLFTIIGFGTFGAYPNHIPGDCSLKRGDLIRWDVGCEYLGYVTDTARSGCFGTPNEIQKRRWNAVLAGQLAAFDKIAPGVAAADLFRIGMDTTKNSGIPEIRRKHIGHGIGIDMYEYPSITPNETIILEPGMVFNLEVVFYEFGFGALQVEDTIYVTKEGCECFTKIPRKLFVFE